MELRGHVRSAMESRNEGHATETDDGLLLNFGGDSLEFRTKTRRYRNPKIDADLTA